MSEETAVDRTSADAPDTNGLALDLAMEEARSNPGLRDDVAAFLRNQNSLIDIQKHHLHEQYKHLHLSVWEKQLGVLLRVATVIVGIAFATAVTLMVWEAAHNNGLIIEPFGVPPDLAARGLTGQAVASRVQDNLNKMQAATASFRPARSYANNWGNDIKVEIPETGVSIGEFQRFLRDWLGHDIHITGEVWHTDSGIAITARTTGSIGAVITGSPSEFDALVQKAAEHVYADTQPYRYANYMRPTNINESLSIYRRLTESASPQERGWAWYGIGNVSTVRFQNNRAAIWAFRKAVVDYPDNTLLHAGMGTAEENLGHDEAALAERLIVQRLLNRDSIPDVDPAYLGTAKKAWSWALPMQLGDYAQAASIARSGIALPDQSGQRVLMRAAVVRALARQHDGGAVRAYLQGLQLSPSAVVTPLYLYLRFQVEAALGNWQNLAAAGAEVEKAVKSGNVDHSDRLPAGISPWLALAKAKLGDLAGAQGVINATPADCYDCGRIKGQIAQIAGQPTIADYWFARAIHDAPSIPFAYADWGQALLTRGQPDAAIEKFNLSNAKGPHFADALEGWGEALMAKNQSHLALAKFVEAGKYAPNWGRLHLKWGQALAYSGNKEEAAKHFARAAALDLTPSEKQELARHR